MPKNIITTESLNISAHGAVNTASITMLNTTFFILIKFLHDEGHQKRYNTTSHSVLWC